MIERTPPNVLFHRITATAKNDILLAPQWCAEKWPVINGIAAELARRDSYQGEKTALLPTFDIDQ